MNISPEMKVELESRAKKTKDRHEYARLCVILARSEGMSIELIAQAHRISRDSVYRHLAEYETEKKTQHDDRGGSPSKLSEAQTRELVEHLRGTTYLYAKHICNYVRATYGVDYTISGMTFWLKTQVFVYKEPIKVPGKLDPESKKRLSRLGPYNVATVYPVLSCLGPNCWQSGRDPASTTFNRPSLAIYAVVRVITKSSKP